MDKVIAGLIIENESLKLRVEAIENALTNLAGFVKETGDGSRQGRIVFTRKQALQVETVVVPEVKEESVQA